MNKIKPTCPYCGGEMVMYDNSKGLYWMHCLDCHALSPEGNTVSNTLEKAMHRASPWHSVKEGLPQDGTICVVHGHSEDGTEGYGIAPCTMTGWSGVGATTFEVTHWMPVPDATKEAEK